MAYISLKSAINRAVKTVSFNPYLVRFEFKAPAQSYNCLVVKDAFNFGYLSQEGVGAVGSMSYHYTRNDLPLFICRHDPSAGLRTIHDVMVQFDEQWTKWLNLVV